VTEDEVDAFASADVGEPVPREHAFGGHDKIVAIGATSPRNASGVDLIVRWMSTWPVASRMHTYIVFT
jgi:hypothetical protein